MRISKIEKILNVIVIELVIFLVGKIFYGNFLAGFILTPITAVLYRERKEQILEKKRNVLEREFKDMLISISDGLKTGYSVENAIQASYKDMGMLYGKSSVICSEIKIMISQLKLNVGTEKVIGDFANRIKLKNAKVFAEVFCVSKKTGGNMTQIIKNVTDDIALKEETREEIYAAITEKRMEQKVMTIIPIFIIVYITLTSPGFLNIMYETLFGRLIMTGCIAAYVAAYIWGEKIIRSINQE